MAKVSTLISFSVHAEGTTNKGIKYTTRVSHSQDEKTKEFRFDLIDENKANKLMNESKKNNPEMKYCVVKKTIICEHSEWK